MYNGIIGNFRHNSTKLCYSANIRHGKREAGMSSVVFYDKHTIITIMKRAMTRLRAQHIHVPTIVAAIHDSGVDMTRARFDDLFLTRPERDVSASLPVFEAVIGVLFAHDPGILTSQEFFELAIAIRLPLDQFQLFRHYFPQDEWHQAMQAFGFDVATVVSAQTIIGRDVELSLWHEAVVARTNLVITGMSGVGKSAFAHELLHIYDAYHGRNSYVIAGQQITSVQHMYALLAQAMHIPTGIPDMLVAQLSYAVRRERPYVLITDIDSMSHLAPHTLLAALQTSLPELSCIVTAQMLHVPGYTHIALEPLRVGHGRSPACQLFRHVRMMQSLPDMSQDTMMELCRHTAGIPLAIVVLANTHQLPLHAVDYAVYVRVLCTELASHERNIMVLLSLFPRPVTARFITDFAGVVCGSTSAQLPRIIAGLVQRHLIVPDTYQGCECYTVHALVRAELHEHYLPQLHDEMMTGLTDALCVVDEHWDDTYQQYGQLFARADVVIVQSFVECLMAAHRYSDAAQVLIRWHRLWIRFGMERVICVLVDQCLREVDTTPLQTSALYHLRGCVSLECEDARAAVPWLQRALTTTQYTDPHLHARVMLDYAYMTLHTTPRLSATELMPLYAQLVDARDHFGHHQLLAWYARGDNLLSYFAWHMGDLRLAIEHNDAALRYFQHEGHSLGLLDTMCTRGLILTDMGDCRGARNYLTQARRAFMQLDCSYDIAICTIRLATSFVYETDYTNAWTTLRNATALSEYTVSLEVALYYLDAYSATMAYDPQLLADALMLYALCNRFRSEYAIYRGGMLDTVLDLHLRESGQPTAPVHSFHSAMTLVDVLSTLHTIYPDD